MLSASADAMLSFAIPCPALEQAGVLDIVGTGGDTWDTFNVSTAASILCAAAGAKGRFYSAIAVTRSSSR